MRRAAAIAEHHPDQLYARNRSLLGMTHNQLHDFASTPERGLPERVPQHPHRNLGKYLHPKRSRMKDHITRLRSAGAFKGVRRG